MARRRGSAAEPPPDPYEHGFEAVQRQRLELPPISPEGERLKAPPRVSWRWVVGGLAVVVALALGRGFTGGESSLKASCDRTQIALGQKSIASRGTSVLHWSATAPRGTRFVVAVNAATVTIDAKGVPHATTAGAGSTQVIRVETMPNSCLAHGVFGVLVEPGSYSVSVFTFTGTVGVAAATTRLKVTSG